MTPSSLNNLTDAEKRVRIAEACGWRFEPSKEREKRGYLIAPNYKARVTIWKDWKFGGESALPDYLNDLNAMAEAERNAPCALYCDTLRKVLSRHINCHPSQVVESRMVMATAAQRADAFLATITP